MRHVAWLAAVFVLSWFATAWADGPPATSALPTASRPGARLAQAGEALAAACSRHELVFICTIKAVKQITVIRDKQETIFSFAMEDLETLRGARPEQAACQYHAVAGKDPEPQAGKRMIVAANQELWGKKLALLAGVIGDATEENLATARQAVRLPIGWSWADGKAVCPWAAWGERAWPKGMQFQPPTDYVCAKTGRPALLAGAGLRLEWATLPAKPVTAPAVLGGVYVINTTGDGPVKVTLKNTTDQPVEVAALLQDGKTVFWADALIVLHEGHAYPFPPGGLTPGVKPVKLAPGQSLSGEVNLLKAKGVPWPQNRGGRAAVSLRMCLGELSVPGSFNYCQDYHGKLAGAP